MSFERIKRRLITGRPLVLDSDTGASFRTRGVSVDTPGALGSVLRYNRANVFAHYAAEVKSRVDVLSALTADTTPRALAEVGMEHRSALLTGLAVDLALAAAESSPKPVAVAGLLGSDMVSPMGTDRLHDELEEHAMRIATAGVELIVARGQGSRLSLMAAVVAAAQTGLPTWAVVECTPSTQLAALSDIAGLLETLIDAGASAVLFEVADKATGLQCLRRALDAGAHSGLVPGVLLAGSNNSVRGFPDDDADPQSWVQPTLDLTDAGARLVGGGAGTSEAHTEALAIALGSLHPSVPVASLAPSKA